MTASARPPRWGRFFDTRGEELYPLLDHELRAAAKLLAGMSAAWGVGRHLLGSQIFDYWRDPWGQKHEHYADGDLFDSSQKPGYHLLDRQGLYQWGPDLPDDFIDARLTPRRLWTVCKTAVIGRG
jgi:hypothetical protein